VTTQAETLRRQLLGWAPACELIEPGVDLGRDLVLEDRPSGRDLALVDKIDCLGQSLAIALTTLLGSDLFNTEFGFDGLNALTEGGSPVMTRERVRVAVVNVLRKDPRVRGILDVKLEDGRLDPVPAGSRVLDVRVSFETVTGDPVTTDLGRVVPGV